MSTTSLCSFNSQRPMRGRILVIDTSSVDFAFTGVHFLVCSFDETNFLLGQDGNDFGARGPLLGTAPRRSPFCQCLAGFSYQPPPDQPQRYSILLRVHSQVVRCLQMDPRLPQATKSFRVHFGAGPGSDRSCDMSLSVHRRHGGGTKNRAMELKVTLLLMIVASERQEILRRLAVLR